MNLDEFLLQAGGSGPCVGIQLQAIATGTLPVGIEVRAIDGERTGTIDALYDVFAEAWGFPPWFGRNADAFDDFMRDLDNMIQVAYGKPPAPGYFTHITDAQLILADEPEAFPWFARCMPFYRDYYRDEANPQAAFGLLLTATPDQLDQIRDRWTGVGMPVATVTP